MVEARVGGTLVDVGLAVGACGRCKNTLRRELRGFHDRTFVIELTGESREARANVAAGHVLAGAAVHARVGFALVVVDVAVLAAPARVTQALVAEGEKF